MLVVVAQWAGGQDVGGEPPKAGPVDGFGSLPLRRRALPSPPPCRFIPALRKVRQNHSI